jgi:hypothetical protein
MFVVQKSKDGGDQRQATKKWKTIFPSQITNFFNNQRPYNKFDLAQQAFLEDLVLYIAKGYQPVSFVENLWLKHLTLHQCGHVRFPIRHQLVDEMLLSVVETTKEKYVLPTLTSCITCTTSFDLWMSHVGYDILLWLSVSLMIIGSPVMSLWGYLRFKIL